MNRSEINGESSADEILVCGIDSNCGIHKPLQKVILNKPSARWYRSFVAIVLAIGLQQSATDIPFCNLSMRLLFHEGCVGRYRSSEQKRSNLSSIPPVYAPRMSACGSKCCTLLCHNAILEVTEYTVQTKITERTRCARISTAVSMIRITLFSFPQPF
jgi:hypothetical protein